MQTDVGGPGRVHCHFDCCFSSLSTRDFCLFLSLCVVFCFVQTCFKLGIFFLGGAGGFQLSKWNLSAK